MKKQCLFAYVMLFFTLFSLSSCSKATLNYTDTISAAMLADEVVDELEDADFLTAQGNWLGDYVTLPDGLSDYRICYSADGSNLNEFGIWHVRKDQIAPLEATLRTYLAESLLRNREFYNSYIPKETPKLERAEVRVFGNYVCYAILDQKDREIFFQTIKNELLNCPMK